MLFPLMVGGVIRLKGNTAGALNASTSEMLNLKNNETLKKKKDLILAMFNLTF